MTVTVLKIGGSLATQPSKLRSLCDVLSKLSQNFHLLVVPGGGEFADVIREIDARFSLSCWASHRMSILGQDQYGLMLKDLITDSVVTDKLPDGELPLGEVHIFLPSRLFFEEDPLENSWDVTSDSISAYIAARIKADKVLFVTDVDGIFTENPKLQSHAQLIKEISPQELLSYRNRTSVDRFLAKLLIQSALDCYVINGLFPERIQTLLEGKQTICTRIKNL